MTDYPNTLDRQYVDSQGWPAGRINGAVTLTPRYAPQASVSSGSSGRLRLTYFTSDATILATSLAVSSGSIAATGTSLCRYGIYSIAANGNGTLIAATDSDTNIFASINTVYSRSFAAPVTITAGNRYAAGPLWVGSGTVPYLVVYTIYGTLYLGSGSERLAGYIPSLSDLPASFVDSAVTGSYGTIGELRA